MLNNMKLSTKLIGGFGIIFFFLLSITAVMFNALNKTSAAFEIFMEEDFGIASNALKVETLMLQCRSDEKDYLQGRDKTYLRRYTLNMNALQEATRAILDLSDRSSNYEMKEKAQALLPLIANYKKYFEEVVNAYDKEGGGSAEAQNQKVQQLVAMLNETAQQRELAVQAVSKTANKGGMQKNAVAKSTVKNYGNTALVLVFIALLATIVIAVLIIRSVLNQLGEDPRTFAGIANRMAAGDLGLGFYSNTKEVKGVLLTMKKMVDNLKRTADIAGEIAQGNLAVKVGKMSDRDTLGNALETMVDKLSAMIAEINVAADNVAGGAWKMSSTSQALSQGVTEQASSLEQIVSSMNEIAVQTRHNAENASGAKKLAAETKTLAEKVNGQMGRMVDAIREINKSSRSILSIIKVIDEVAFQTNMLALNAAVEAARAGKHGKGFAVVADEVRRLAARSAKAARETAELIEGSVKKVDDGTEMADMTADALKDIVAAAGKMTDLVTEIATASNEQAQSVSQISIGLGQVGQVTQQNALYAEESASAAHYLSSQSRVLQQQVSAFKIDERSMHSPAESPQAGAGRQQAQAPARVRPRALLDGKAAGIHATEPAIHLDDREFGKY